MDKKLFLKIAAICLMSLLLLVPLALIEDQIRDRSQRQNEVQESIANSAAGAQTLIAPVIAVSYREQTEVLIPKEEGGNGKLTRPGFTEHSFYVSADSLEMSGEATVETRNRGIYQARLFQLGLATKGHFSLKPLIEAHNAQAGVDATVARPGRIIDAEAALILGISDPRGVNNDPEVIVNGKTYHFAAPSTSASESGIQNVRRLSVDLGRIDIQRANNFDVSFQLQLTGTSRLAIAPTGDENRIELKSAWPHPNFGGRFLPTTRTVNTDGFTARWEISHLARDFEATLDPNRGEILSIDFVDPVNVYLQSERAVKYGVLFIVLTFAGFFLTEILRRSPIHSMQYLLVGLALAIFFLLLIALSEHLPFYAAYGLSAIGCIGLIAFYLAGALGGAKQGLAFGGGLTGLYGVLYGVLLSEDNALLMGSLLLFLALGTIMLATRRLNWYRLTAQISGDQVQ